MRAKGTAHTRVTLTEAARDLRKVLRVVDRTGFVRLTENGKARYHIGKEESEKQLLTRLRASVREHRAGKTRKLRSLADL